MSTLLVIYNVVKFICLKTSYVCIKLNQQKLNLHIALGAVRRQSQKYRS